MTSSGRLIPAHLADEVKSTVLGGVRLGDDLERFHRVVGVDAPEAAVLYAGRVLELLAGEQVRALGAAISGSVFGNLVRLSDLGVLAELPARFSHTLRRLANEARHIHRPLRSEDAALAQALLEHVLRWHFVRFPRGPRLASIYVRTPDEADAAANPLAALIDLLDAAPRGEVLRRSWAASPALEASSFAICLYAESLIACGGADDLAVAAATVTAALAREPGDLRLRQLDAWLARLGGATDAAAAKLEALLAESEDVETLGLLAGTYKRMWSGGGKVGLLRRTADLYRRAWKQSDHRSTYAGINAASMSLLDGDRDVGRRIAAAVEALYEPRRAGGVEGGAIAFTGFWDQATYAEVKLLAGDLVEAARAYRDAFTRHADQPGLIASTRAQLALLLPVVGAATDDPDRFLDAT